MISARSTFRSGLSRSCPGRAARFGFTPADDATSARARLSEMYGDGTLGQQARTRHSLPHQFNRSMSTNFSRWS